MLCFNFSSLPTTASVPLLHTSNFQELYLGISPVEITSTYFAFSCFSSSAYSSVYNSSICRVAYTTNLGIIWIIFFSTSGMQTCHKPTSHMGTCERKALCGHFRIPHKRSWKEKRDHISYIGPEEETCLLKEAAVENHMWAHRKKRATGGRCHSRGPVRLNLNISPKNLPFHWIPSFLSTMLRGLETATQLCGRQNRKILFSILLQNHMPTHSNIWWFHLLHSLRSFTPVHAVVYILVETRKISIFYDNLLKKIRIFIWFLYWNISSYFFKRCYLFEWGGERERT